MNHNISLSIQILEVDYHKKLATSLFSGIANDAWSMLLRSASDTHPDSRYDILVTRPVATLVTKGELTTITSSATETTSREDPFTLLQQTLNRTLPYMENPYDLPFIGGALGYFSYDLGRRIEKLSVIAVDDIAQPDMAVGIYDRAVIVDHHDKKAWVVANDPQQHFQWLTSQSAATEPEFQLTSVWRSNMTKENYRQKFDQVQQYLLSGDCYQINLAQRFHATYEGSAWQAYQKLEQANLAPFSAYIKLDNSSVLSVSPERFLQIANRQIETKPIKGTRPRAKDRKTDLANAQQLMNTEKDQAENLMIVDLLRNDIGKVAEIGSVKVPKLFDIESFPAVHHLVSTVVAKLDERYSVTDCLRACFPGGSITGAPKVRAMEIIEELEPHRRNVYCGSIGYISRCGTMDSSITIRTLVASNNQIYAWAGGGLVADSQVDAEYQETLDKLSRILPVLEK